MSRPPGWIRRAAAPPLALTLALAVPLPAQTPAPQTMAPPPYLQIFREEVKPGHAGSVHRATEAGWPRAFARAKTTNHYLAMTTVFGPPEAWFMSGSASVAEIEQENQAVEQAPGLTRELDRLSQADAAHLSGYRSLLARYRPELSNASEIRAPEMRVWEVIVFKVRPGRDASFAEAATLYRSVVEQAKAEYPWATYEVMAGMPGPTYLVFAPHRRLAEIDPATGAGAAIQKAMSEETMKKFGTLFEGFSSVETLVFEVSPEMSYLAADWIAQDPKFWGRKAQAAARTQP